MHHDVLHHVTHGVLKMEKIRKSMTTCKIESQEENKFTVSETVDLSLNKGFKLATEEVWTVTHEKKNDKFHFSCNGLVHSGISFAHIVTVVLQHYHQAKN